MLLWLGKPNFHNRGSKRSGDPRWMTSSTKEGVPTVDTFFFFMLRYKFVYCLTFWMLRFDLAHFLF
jgi:hypothetical protein